MANGNSTSPPTPAPVAKPAPEKVDPKKAAELRRLNEGKEKK